MQWYLKVLQNYIGFSGRARRKEYWMFTLINFIVIIILSILESLLGLPGFISGLYSLAVLIPGLAVSVRRLHDTGKSGWWLLLSFIPIIGAIILLVFFALDSEDGANQYGPNPKY